jgi:hypothetical protein
VWYSTGLFAVPVRWVLVRDPEGKFKTQALLCTDLEADRRLVGGGVELMAQCSAIKRDGTRCKGIAIEGYEWCYAHHPDYSEERRRNANRAVVREGAGAGQRPVPQDCRTSRTC